MDSVHGDRSGSTAGGTTRVAPAERRGLLPLKILVAGGFGVGKTTLVGALSEVPPLSTEQQMTSLSDGVDDALVLYLFGTPGQSRFWFMWDELARGAVGAVVLVDLRRIDDSFAAIDYFENRGLPFVVALNAFPGTNGVDDEAVRDALAVPPGCPLVHVDARDDASCTRALIVLVEHALARSA
jgi:signal recognition particle receptor subunit beta